MRCSGRVRDVLITKLGILIYTNAWLKYFGDVSNPLSYEYRQYFEHYYLTGSKCRSVKKSNYYILKSKSYNFIHIIVI